MSTYYCLSEQIYVSGRFSIVPIRNEDRLLIMQWRNEQLYHLRQNRPLTINDQDKYFDKVIAPLFTMEQPEQILFSYLEEGECIGYGGLVHINWHDSNAEISFVLSTKLQQAGFEEHWIRYLGLIEQVAFSILKLQKIYTYAFDLRPLLYWCLEKSGFNKEAVLTRHSRFGESYVDVVIHCKFKDEKIEVNTKNFYLRQAGPDDAKLLFIWANDPTVRENSISDGSISWETHADWLKNKLTSQESKVYILVSANGGENVGQIRIDLIDSKWVIDYSIDKNFRNKGLGKEIVGQLMQKFNDYNYEAIVRKDNFSSVRIFNTLGFHQAEPEDDSFLKFIYDNK